ncbi:ATP-binding protein [Methylophaga sp.]|uniref:sensor histidine kinase n=1 Tax=Methylophaga sp. TaxID=2024840 RepID=UPI003F697A36
MNNFITHSLRQILLKTRRDPQTQVTTKVPHSLALFLLFMIGAITSVGVAVIDYQEKKTHVFELSHETLTGVTSKVESIIQQKLSVIPALIALVKAEQYTDPSDPEQFQNFKPVFTKFAKELNIQLKGILSIQLAPDGVVSLITNERRNSAALNHDLLVDDTRRLQVLSAIANRNQLTAGPLELIQGGEAIISRKAVFSARPTFPSDRYVSSGRVKADTPWLKEIPNDFWGLATVIVDTNTIYEEAGLSELSSNYNLAIRGRHGLGEDGEIFWGDETVFQNPTVKQFISVPGGQWVFAIKAEHHALTSTYIIALLGIIFTFLLVFAYHSQRARVMQFIQTRAKSDFLTKMSHELRTPLNAIIGFGDMMHHRQADLSEKNKRSLEQIRSSSRYLLSLINDLLDLSLIESGKFKLNLTEFNLENLVDDCLTLLKNEAEVKHVHMERHSLANADFHLKSDHDRLKQIIINLLSNAIKYNRSGGTVKIYLRKQDDHNISIEIKDTGSGIPEDKLAELFDMFVRLDQHRHIQGSGIGLVITKHLVELLEGKIEVESSVDTGTSFIITIPSHLRIQH